MGNSDSFSNISISLEWSTESIRFFLSSASIVSSSSLELWFGSNSTEWRKKKLDGGQLKLNALWDINSGETKRFHKLL